MGCCRTYPEPPSWLPKDPRIYCWPRWVRCNARSSVCRYVLTIPLRRYDNWLVDHAFHDPRIMLVDVTSTVPLLHQNLPEDANGTHGHRASDVNHNLDLIAENVRKLSLCCQVQRGSNIAVRRRKYLIVPKSCLAGQRLLHTSPVEAPTIVLM